ncbi:MAG: Hsp20/alpha crystallin family protein [Myxococcota bacterium]
MKEFESFANQLNRFFAQPTTFDTDRELLATTDWAPSCDVCETPEGYRIEAELPGVDKKDVNVSLENGVLRITGERKEDKETKNEKMHRREMFRGSFARSFTLPEDADWEQVDAQFKDGILNVRLGKTRSKPAHQRQIDVK